MPAVQQYPEIIKKTADSLARASGRKLELVTALDVFSAGRQSFEAIVRAHALPAEALVLIFAALPLRVSGWESDKTKITAAGRRQGWPVWRVERV